MDKKFFKYVGSELLQFSLACFGILIIINMLAAFVVMGRFVFKMWGL
jgi:hypothetical protein